MGGVRAGVVVLVRFPFSDLSSSKLRPALVVAPAGGTDWIRARSLAIPTATPLRWHSRQDRLLRAAFLGRASLRPVKLFTANESIVVRPVGRLTARMHRMVVDAIVNVFQAALK